MTINWINPQTIFFFGGLENISNSGLNDVICLGMDDLHFSFPFVAGEYPLPRYGHASCNYVGTGDQDNMMLLGGIDQGFQTMDIFTLVEHNRAGFQEWEKIIEKDEFEEKATKEAAKYVYTSRKHCLSLHDLVVQEKSKGIDIRRREIEV
jgi:hypothetical protein